MLAQALVLGPLLLVNAVGVVLVLFQMPGTWLILGATGVAGWILREQQVLGWWTLGILLGLAVVGEIVETLSGAVGSRRSGGSRRGALLSIVTGIVGATVGASLAGSLTLGIAWAVPVWLLIVLAGGAVGAALGALGGDRLAGRSWPDATRAGVGAAVGRLGGTAGKVVVAALMWLVVLVAIFV
jgi:uncharacterized protein YqgC (DUF456 family)